VFFNADSLFSVVLGCGVFLSFIFQEIVFSVF